MSIFHSDVAVSSRGLVIQDLEVVCRVRDSGRHHHCRRRYLHGGHRKEAGSGDHHDDHTDLDYSERYPGTLLGENAVALLLRRESYRRRRRLRPHPLLVFQQLVGPVGKIRFSNHHAQLWKGHGNKEIVYFINKHRLTTSVPYWDGKGCQKENGQST